ncbi:MAG: FixH family protein [Ignavibacteriaceae bacterium]|nr:FixH family protein [Ignavibacteriaceae bacterium]
MKIKWNWGTGIVVFIAFFIMMNVVIIIFAFSEKVDLVTPNYYEKELKYQDEIDAQQKTLQLGENVSVEYQSQVLSLQLPKKFYGKEISGNILLYRPSDSLKDVKIILQPDSSGKQIVSVKELIKGMWKVQIKWSFENISYSDEKSIYIN